MGMVDHEMRIRALETGAGSSGGSSYSTSEQRIGTWIDGKPIMRLVCEYDNFTPSSSSWTDLPNKSELNTLVTYPLNVTLMNDDYSVRPNYWYGQIKTDFIGVAYNRLIIEYVKKE